MTREMGELRARYFNILEKIQVVRSKFNPTSEVTLVAVSKTQPVEAIQALYEFGHRDFGENYVQELKAKAETLESKGLKGIRWHFIGHLQSNKVKMLLPWISSIHSVHSLRLAEEIAKHRSLAIRIEGPLPIFLEVNLEGEASKEGLSPENVLEYSKQISSLKELKLEGLMAIPDPEKEPSSQFKRLQELERSCQPYTHGCLSMGMSGDFETAIQYGATHVRVGTSLFGKRPTPKR